MKSKAVTIKARRDYYTLAQANRGISLTVGELIAKLQRFDADCLVVTSNDNGHTYGAICNFCDVVAREFDTDGN